MRQVSWCYSIHWRPFARIGASKFRINDRRIAVTWRADGPQGNETGKIHDRIAPYVSGRGLDLGCGWWKLKVPKISPGDFCLGVDGAYHGMAPDVDIHCDMTNLDLFADESFDYVYSSHTLEDMPYPGVVIKEWWRLIKPDGRLILYLPLA